MAIGSISELAECTDIEELKKQHHAYVDDIHLCMSMSPNCQNIAKLMATDPIVKMFIGAISAKTSIKIRIRELEGKDDD